MTSLLKPIRNAADYNLALSRIDELISAAPKSPQADELGVLAILVDAYEDESFPIGNPSPLEAIRFRMDQADLKPADLATYLGGRSRVSEILNGKRKLTISMIRALHKHLKIPADVLIAPDIAPQNPEAPADELSRFPIREMVKRNWFPAQLDAATSLRRLMEDAGLSSMTPASLYKKSGSSRFNARTNEYALFAWCMKVLAIARARFLDQPFQKSSIDERFLRLLAGLSRLPDGPKRAVDALEAKGIAVVYLRHLPQSFLDGAAMMTREGRPVIGLTLRHDRLDNFWFCLLHEVTHVWKHLSPENSLLIDDHELSPIGSDVCAIEDEADHLAQEALIPSDAWSIFCKHNNFAENSVLAFAQSLNVHPAIVAGRVRRETQNYRRLTRLVGLHEVTKHFEENV